MTHHVIVALAALGIAGQVIAAAPSSSSRSPVGAQATRACALGDLGIRALAAFVVSAIGTGGSLFFSEIAGFVPCELCWYQRICMYPLSIITLLAALRATSDRPLPAPLPIVGACISVYHLLVENGVVGQSSACLVSAPGGCATKWIDEFGYMTIPTLALTGFVLLIELLVSRLSARARPSYGDSRCLAEKQASNGGDGDPRRPRPDQGRAERRQASPRVLIGAGRRGTRDRDRRHARRRCSSGGSSNRSRTCPRSGHSRTRPPGAADVQTAARRASRRAARRSAAPPRR